MARPKRPVIFLMGCPEWMVTFGDMMSLLLTFFILLFSVAQMKDVGQVYDMIYALQGMVSGSRPVHGFLMPTYQGAVDDVRQEKEGERRGFGESGVHAKRVIQSEGDGFHSLRVRDQLKITLEGKVLFEEGLSSLLPQGRKLLDGLLATRLRDGPFRIVIRGHAAPGEGAGSDEDDLGFHRAREVRDYFTRSGVPASRFELQTVGSREPPPGVSATMPENRSRLRRVEVFVSPQAVGLPVEDAAR